MAKSSKGTKASKKAVKIQVRVPAGTTIKGIEGDFEYTMRNPKVGVGVIVGDQLRYEHPSFPYKLTGQLFVANVAEARSQGWID